MIGCSSSTFIRDSILKIINVEQKMVEKEFNPMRVFARELNIKSLQAKKESTNVELEKLLGITEIK